MVGTSAGPLRNRKGLMGNGTDKTARLEPTVLDWARLAAFLDGEGCITLCNRTGCTRVQGRRVYVSVANTDVRLICWLKDTFGGNVRPHSSTHANSMNAKPLFVWEASTRDRMQKVLESALPYFIIKREQAEIALAYLRLNRIHHCYRRPVTQEEEAERNKLFTRIRVLNSGEAA